MVMRVDFSCSDNIIWIPHAYKRSFKSVTVTEEREIRVVLATNMQHPHGSLVQVPHGTPTQWAHDAILTSL